MVTSGSSRYVVSKLKCSVFENIVLNGATVAKGGLISFTGTGNRLFIAGPPTKTYIQKTHNRVYQEGWFQHAGRNDFLYYIIRYEFYENAPFVKLVITFTDRHDKQKTEAQFDKYWKSQWVYNIKVELNVPLISKNLYVEQHNAFDYKRVDAHGVKPYIELEEKKGSPAVFTENATAGFVSRKQLEISSKAKENWVRFYPLQKGAHPVSVVWNGKAFPEYAAYKRAKGVVAQIHHTKGTSSVVYDQGAKSSWLELGAFEFDNSSFIDITGERKDGTLLVDAVRVGKETIPVFNRHDDHLADNGFTLFVKDFWRNYPVAMNLQKGKATAEFIKTPAIFMGGMGKTFELMYSFGNTSSAQKKLYAAPDVSTIKNYTDPLYFSLSTSKEYAQLTDTVRQNLLPYLEKQRSVGWRNWGDYQIGNSYDQTEDWANLQYDLGYGLLMLYIRTKDPEIWKLAQASVYHLMDLDLVKYSPFAPKYNGSVHRKGEMPVGMSHVASEPIVPENFAFRSLYLYYLLTGDLFALECVKMSVDNFLEFTNSNSRLDFASHGDRDTAWILLGLLFGEEKFRDAKYLDRATKVVDRLLDKEKTLGRLPGGQPVWQGQTVEALIKYYERTKNKKVKDAIIRHVTWLKDYAIAVNPANGRYKMIYAMKDKDFIPVNPQWTDESNYFFLHLNSFMYVYELTKDSSFKKLADNMFHQAAKDHKKFLGPRQASSFLGFPYYYLEKGLQVK